MLNLTMYSKNETKELTKTQVVNLLLDAQEMAESEYKRAVFWEKDARKKDRDATNANTTVLETEVKSLKKQIEFNEEERIVDIMTVRQEWTKSEAKQLKKLEASNRYADRKSDELDTAMEKWRHAEDQAKYWEEAWGEQVDEGTRDKLITLEKVTQLQARIISMLDSA